MPQPFTDRELEQLDRHEEKRQQNWGKPAPLAPVFVEIFNSLGFEQRSAEEQQEQQS